MIEDTRNCLVAAFDDAIDVRLDLTDTHTGVQERVVVVNNHYAVTGMVTRFARRQRISPRAVQVHVTPKM